MGVAVVSVLVPEYGLPQWSWWVHLCSGHGRNDVVLFDSRAFTVAVATSVGDGYLSMPSGRTA